MKKPRGSSAKKKKEKDTINKNYEANRSIDTFTQELQDEKTELQSKYELMAMELDGLVIKNQDTEKELSDATEQFAEKIAQQLEELA